MRNSKDFSIEYIEYCCGISWFIRKGAFVWYTGAKGTSLSSPPPHRKDCRPAPRQGQCSGHTIHVRPLTTSWGWKSPKTPTGRLRTKTPRARAGVQAVLPLWPHYCQYDTARGPGSPQTTLTCDWVQRGACSEGRDRRICHSFSSFFHSGLQPDRYKNRQFT